MARLSPEEMQQLEALQARAEEPDEPDGDDFDVVIQNEKGQTVTMPYSRAKKLLAKWGFEIEDVIPPPAGGDPNADPEIDPEADPANAGGQPPRGGGKGYFRGK
jgi:hypothetical protein